MYGKGDPGTVAGGGDNVRGMETLLISYCNFFIQEYYIFIRVFI